MVKEQYNNNNIIIINEPEFMRVLASRYFDANVYDFSFDLFTEKCDEQFRRFSFRWKINNCDNDQTRTTL